VKGREGIKGPSPSLPFGNAGMKGWVVWDMVEVKVLQVHPKVNCKMTRR